MIIKGASRAAPSQLGRHLARVDTNERVHILQLQSPTSSPTEAFEDWQTLAEGTRGYKGLYHANIDPAAKYQMTEDQWLRAVEVLEEELGFIGQPRAVVMHEKNGREHIHVVWARTDIDTMTLKSDGHNYQAHERASLRLEQEFGHELVPGKHAKRDRDAQPEMPTAEVNHDEWQQAERGALDHRARKEQVTALYRACDNGPAFKSALEDADYILARGDRRDFVIMDSGGRAHSLGRQLPGITAKELRAFMADIDPAALPSVKEARAELREVAQLKEPLQPDDTATAKMLEALAIRHRQEFEQQERRFGAETTALQKAQQQEVTRVTEKFVADWVKKDMESIPPEPGVFERLIQNVRESVSEDARQQRQDAETRRAKDMDDRFNQAARTLGDELREKHSFEMAALGQRQERDRAELPQAHAAERERRIADAIRAQELQLQLEERQREAQTRDRDGPNKGGGRAR